jgi:hypothetical protein
MQAVSLKEFRATLVIVGGETIGNKEELYTYWNNREPKFDDRDRESILHIVRKEDGSFYLEIGNMVYLGSLDELEERLFIWAADEGFFD